MNILASLAPPSSFQIGIRAICRQSERSLYGAAVVRQLSTTSRATSQPCRAHSIGLGRPSRLLFRQSQQSRHEQLLPRTAIRAIFTFRAIVHYSQLPESYEDAKGLPFRKEPLNRTEVKQIFGPNITPTSANQLLKIIHGRRVAGTLDDPDLQANTADFHPNEKIKALEYLRKHIPVDEVINAGLRAEDELRLLEEQEASEETQEQYEQASTQQPQAPPAEAQQITEEHHDAPTGRLPRKETDGSPYGETMFDRIRKRNIAKREEEERQLEEERLKREEEEALGNIGGLQKEMAAPKVVSPWRQKHIERATSDLEAPPEMEELGARDWRVWPDIPPAAATCLGLMLLNVVVFGLWKFPPAWAILNRYMLLVPSTPRPLQLLGAIFSHQTFGHLATNMICLWFFGIRLHDEIGRGNFLALYFASGTIGFLASLCNLVLFRGITFTTLGASGAIYGIITAFFWMHRKEEFKIVGLPPDPYSGPTGAVFLGLLVGLHIWAGLFSISRAAMNMDIASHFGGIAAGLVGIELVQRHLAERAKAAAARDEERSKAMDVMDKLVDQKPTGEKPS
ncbi:hypothetical protein KJ359_013316 [Pestalotiopsis sp. 9143b]|nr:hypothetical protein KJ359_013316 [Pestalotiopsis sp. 9143b]